MIDRIVRKNDDDRIGVIVKEFCSYCVDNDNCANYCAEIRNYLRKYGARCRNKNLDPDTSAGIGYITEVLVAKYIGIKTCFDEIDNFNHRAFDMYQHEKWGRIDAKGSKLLFYKNKYGYHYFNIKKNKIPNFFFCIGYDENRKHVLRVYIVHNNESINNLDGLAISTNYSIYHKFRENEEVEKMWDDLFHTLKLDNCNVLKSKI